MSNPPALAHSSLAHVKNGDQNRHYFDGPATDRGLIHENIAVLHHLFDVAQAQWTGHIPDYAGQHYLKRVVQPLSHLAQSAIDQTLAELK